MRHICRALRYEGARAAMPALCAPNTVRAGAPRAHAAAKSMAVLRPVDTMAPPYATRHAFAAGRCRDDLFSPFCRHYTPDATRHALFPLQSFTPYMIDLAAYARATRRLRVMPRCLQRALMLFCRHATATLLICAICALRCRLIMPALLFSCATTGIGSDNTPRHVIA